MKWTRPKLMSLITPTSYGAMCSTGVTPVGVECAGGSLANGGCGGGNGASPNCSNGQTPESCGGGNAAFAYCGGGGQQQ